MRSVFRQLIERQAVKPYIAGHVIDGSSTITLTINNKSVNVSVGANGSWKWEIDDVLTGINRIPNKCDFVEVYAKGDKINLGNTFYINNITERFECNAIVINGTATFANNVLDSKIKTLELIIGSDCTSLSYLARGCNALQKLVLIGDTSNVTAFDYLCRYCTSLKEVFIDCIGSNVSAMGAWFDNTDSVESINFNTILESINLKTLSKLTEQSVLNIINAAAANVTYTLHSTVYGKCASGGEWYSDVQAAIDAKALEGYTVTLISA